MVKKFKRNKRNYLKVLTLISHCKISSLNVLNCGKEKVGKETDTHTHTHTQICNRDTYNVLYERRKINKKRNGQEAT